MGTTARGRLRPSPTTMVATMVATGPTGPTATAMAALDTTVEKVTTWTTAFHSYMPRPKTIPTRNLFQDLQHKTGRYCQRKTKKHVKVQTAMLIVSPTSIKCNNILVAEINNRALCLPKKKARLISLRLGKVGIDKELRRLKKKR